ncbi:MAG: DNA polymerase III subunit chi [Lysobacterales bacterium]
MERRERLDRQAGRPVDALPDGSRRLIVANVPAERQQATPCEVDFYVLEDPSADPAVQACRLALMNWERDRGVFVVTADEAAGRRLDELMWERPGGRFLPHALAGSQAACKAPVNIGPLSALNQVDVVINLCPEAIPQPQRFSRIQEIVPFGDRDASRAKYRVYRELGLAPQTQKV